MTISGFLHFRSKVPRRTLVFLPIGSLMIWLFFLAHSAHSSEGEQAYQQKCVACHTIGGGRLVGPDLKGVTALRDHDWLVRWIVEPDKMLAEGDTLAQQIFQENNKVPMPNLGVSEAEAKSMLAYIEAKSGSESSAKPTTIPQSQKSKPSVKAATSPQQVSDSDKQGGVEIYQKICSACHTIGSGKLIGPDLKGVTSRQEPNWLLRWIQKPDKMLAEGDSHATKLMVEHNDFPMPNYAISEVQAREILVYIANESGEELVFKEPISTSSEPIPETPWKKPVLTSSDDSPDPAIGKQLYLGQRLFAEGGPACITCHRNTDIGSLGGGTLGPDLTKVYLRYGGEIGLTSVLLSTPFPTMQGIFSKQPLSDSEVAHLNAYFAKTVNLEEQPVNIVFVVIGIGIGLLGFVIAYIFIHLIWRKRLTGVRIPLVGR